MSFDFHPFNEIHEKITAGQRLSFDDGVRLYRSDDLPVLGALASFVRRKMNANRVAYSVNLHLNYTNLCTADCLFCSFARKPGEADAYTYSPDEIAEKVCEALLKWRINEVHIVGGHHPDLGLDYYLEMLGKIRALNGSLYIKAFTAPEIDHIARLTGVTIREVLTQFKAAGLDGMPGGGAEIFAPAIRSKICRGKISAEEWLAIHRAAHTLGLGTNATMLYGHIESDEDRVDHVLRLRELQDETRGFHSFIPLAYQAENNRLEKLGQTGGFMDLKVFAVSRLLLDNIPHLKAHWVGLGLKMAQVALSFGVDDLGGTNLNEKIFHDAGSGTPVDLSCAAMERVIRGAGYEPCLVDSSYKMVPGTKGTG